MQKFLPGLIMLARAYGVPFTTTASAFFKASGYSQMFHLLHRKGCNVSYAIEGKCSPKQIYCKQARGVRPFCNFMKLVKGGMKCKITHDFLFISYACLWQKARWSHHKRIAQLKLRRCELVRVDFEIANTNSLF